MDLFGTPTPLVQKYKSAYYVQVGKVHGMMADGVLTKYSDMDVALRLCEQYNARNGLPDINVHKSSSFKKG